jgi:hypothetical protein
MMSRLTTRLREALSRASRLDEPHFGQFALWVLLAAGVYALSQVSEAYQGLHYGNRVSIYPFPIPMAEPERHAWISFISFLPFRVLHSPGLFQTCVIGFHVSAALWFSQLFCRWSAVATAVFYTVAVSLFWEHGAAIAEWWNLVSIALIIFAGWYWHYGNEIRDALRAGEFWRRELFPRWTRHLAVFSVAWFFFLTGVSKITLSGLSWVDGTNLQLAVHRFRIEWNEPLNFFHGWILPHRETASLFSSGVMLLECSAILAVLPLLFPRLRFVRYLIGLGLAGFLCGVFVVFGRWNFETTLVLVILFLWPFDRWVPAAVRGVRQKWGREIPLTTRAGAWGRFQRALIARVDVFGRIRFQEQP